MFLIALIYWCTDIPCHSKWCLQGLLVLCVFLTIKKHIHSIQAKLSKNYENIHDFYCDFTSCSRYFTF